MHAPTLKAPGVHSSFASWLSGVAPYPTRMAWCHTTDGFALRNLILGEEFVPTHCDVFNEDLLYFFYGRPAFRRDESSQIYLSSRAPVVAILNPELIDEGLRLFPFDSGAYKEKYQKWMHKSMELRNFELNCDDDTPERHIAAFFENNTNYLKLVATAPPLPYLGEFEVESLVALFKDPSAMTADDRRLAMELQIGKSLPFNASTVLALVVPDELENAPWLSTFMAGPGRGIDLIKYELAPLRQSGHYQALLEERAMSLQIAKGLV